MHIKEEIAVFWFRRDLRLEDNAGLYRALKSGYRVLPLFIFDKNILSKLKNDDKRVEFIYNAVESLKVKLKAIGSDIAVLYSDPLSAFKVLTSTYTIKEIYTNHDYEKYALNRDKLVTEYCNSNGIAFYSFKDQVIFEKKEILNLSNLPYTVFTPYSKKWKSNLTEFYTKAYPCELYFGNFLKITESLSLPSPNEMAFNSLIIKDFKSPIPNIEIIKKYEENRDFPSVLGTSRLSVHLRFGTVSIRLLTKLGIEFQEKWLNELIWRDFYMNILSNFPHINEGMSFKKEYDRIEWRNNTDEFEKWCLGKTGFPIVDAGMRELNQTGFMHNRVRMIVASFLVKDLLIDWRWGEAYFAEKLMDFDFSANNGGWQWASGSGCDAAPYFRIFNPSSQTEKFDKQLSYIKKYIPELNTFDYPQPIVDHSFARERTLKAYKKALEK
jgi:deoxyribodipyrimidine photo-lyase